jgi:hypothetical protein
MLFARTHAWTTIQRWLIVALAVSALFVFSALVYIYERYYRGPGEEVLYGTWDVPDFPDEPVYIQFNPDQTFSICGLYEGKLNACTTGRWHAGGPNIYLRFNDETMKGQRPWIAHIVEISQNEIRVRWWRDGAVATWKRVSLSSANARDQAIQRTPKAFGVTDLVFR